MASLHDSFKGLSSSMLSSHPAQVSARTYSLALLLSLGPSLVPLAVSPSFARLKRVLQRDLAPDGFAFALTVAVGGGAGLRHLWRVLDRRAYVVPSSSDDSKKHQILMLSARLSPKYKTFLSNLLSSFIGVMLLQAGRHRSRRGGVPIPWTLPVSDGIPRGVSPTLDFTLLLLVRAVDSFVQTIVSSIKRGEVDENERKKQQRKLTATIDAVVFWACSAKIMFSFFYAPEKLPKSYMKWIYSLANIDQRLLQALREIKSGSWSYIRGATPSTQNLLTTYSQDLGYPSSWGNPSILPSHGGAQATRTWRDLGVVGRDNMGGVPCELVHRGIGGNSCTGNASSRFFKAFYESLAIYIPAHFVPVLLTRPQTLLSYPKVWTTLLSAMRSSAFLSTFISSFYMTVCLFHSVMPRWLPFLFSPGRISHDFVDGPYGAILAGCLTCGGASIWIEHPKRRGEMALYVLPRALRALLKDTWVKRNGIAFRTFERLTFAVSLAYLLTAAVYQPNSLRGLSKWALSFIMKGMEHGFWKRRRLGQSSSVEPTPSSTPALRPSTPLPDTSSL